MKNRFIMLCFLVVLITACQDRPTETSEPITEPTLMVNGTPLPFETIDKSDGRGIGPDYEGQEPLIAIFSEVKDIEKYVVTEQAENALLQVDFDTYLIIGVFQGWQGSSGYEVDILAVAQDGPRMLVYADFIEPFPDMVVVDAETSPYQLVKIPKEGLDRNLMFELIVDGVVIQQVEAVIK